MAAYGDMMDAEKAPTPALYAIERGEGESLKFAVIDIWDEDLPVPLDVIRSVCRALDIEPDVFGTTH